VAMFPHERSLVKRMEGKPFVLLGVNGDEAGEALKKKNEEAKITWRSFQNERGEKKGSIAEEWNVMGWPTLYLIDHKGVIRKKWLGSPGDEVIDKTIDALVKEAETKN
jgi:hypothetical protein